MSDRNRLITWDVALLIGIALCVFGHITNHQNLVIGFMTAMLLSNCVRNHITAYKLTGRIY